MATQTKAVATADTEFLQDFAGQGLDDISQNEMSTGFLGMVQPGSTVTDDQNAPGTWRNSATGENYGSVVRVIPVKFQTIWNERSNEPPFTTVKRALPNTIPVDIKQPKNGKGYPKMIDKDTGFEVQELYVYGVILPDHPEAGVLFFNPTVISMRACKSWNSQLKSQILPNGTHAPLFGYSWNLQCELVDNPAKPTEKIAKLTKVTKDVMTSKDVFLEVIKPVLDNGVQSPLAIDAPEEGAE